MKTKASRFTAQRLFSKIKELNIKIESWKSSPKEAFMTSGESELFLNLEALGEIAKGKVDKFYCRTIGSFRTKFPVTRERQMGWTKVTCCVVCVVSKKSLKSRHKPN